MEIVFLILAVVFLVFWRKAVSKVKAAESARSDLESRLTEESLRASKTQDTVDELSKYQAIVDVQQEISNMRQTAAEEIQSQKNTAAGIVDEAKQEAKELRNKAREIHSNILKEADLKLASADAEAKRILDDATSRAKEIAGEAYEIAGKATEYEKTVAAMRNVIEGYGDQYLKPTFSLLDELAEDFGFTEAGQQLKLSRENSSRMIKTETAATCEYVEANRRVTAISFVVDAFNGKVDSILSKTKKDNYGTLEQKIKDAFHLVNHNGRAFRNAKITQEYLSARLEELKWGVIVSQLKANAQEEQRQLREQMREEEKARREFEKAMKDAAKEEDMLRRAMEKAQKQIETATEANRAEFEDKLQKLQTKLLEAEERGQRAMSMAQQTRRGNVYIISNIGSFGENVYKVGMTRRLDPIDRVRELGDASVPFQFDVHAIIESDDAPTLEKDMHKALALMQMNKVNPRKEFFKVSLPDIKSLVENRGLRANWTMNAAASEYKETLAIEEAMKNDPEAKKRWEEYAASIENLEVSQEDID